MKLQDVRIGSVVRFYGEPTVIAQITRYDTGGRSTALRYDEDFEPYWWYGDQDVTVLSEPPKVKR